MATIIASFSESLGFLQIKKLTRPGIITELELSSIKTGVLPKTEEELQLTQVIHNPYVGLKSETLDISDVFSSTFKFKVFSEILYLTTVIDSNDFIDSFPISGNLNFTSNISVISVRTIIVSRTLNLKLNFIGYIEINKNAYTPNVSIGSRFVQTYYGTDLTFGELNVSLPSPELGDVHTLNLTRVQQESRGGTLIIFRDSNWPEIETFSWKFIGLSKALRDSFWDFIEATLGKEITIIDYDNREWKGIILNPNTESRDTLSLCGYIIEFEFEGELQ